MSKEWAVVLVPPGIVTLETVGLHVHLQGRRFRALLARTPVGTTDSVSLGRAAGTYRIVPQLGVLLLRQLCSTIPLRLGAWEEALREFLVSAAWRDGTHALAREYRVQRASPSGQKVVETVLRLPSLRSTMVALHTESLAALDRHDLADQVQIEEFVVDRLEDEDEAVVLVGDRQRAFMMPTQLLRIAGLEREKARGILVATRTGAGVDLDVWPAAGMLDGAVWQPDPRLLALRHNVGA
jgi:hypothetical protein